jgi:hypothetical protein
MASDNRITDQTTEETTQSARSGPFARARGFLRRCAHVVLAMSILGVVLAGVLVVLMTGGRVLPVPAFALDPIETRVNGAMAGSAAIRLDRAELWFDENWRPGLRLLNAEILHPDGEAVAELPDIRATFDLSALRQGRVVPRSLQVDDAEITLRRDVDGAVDLLFVGGARMRPIGSLSDLLDTVDAAFDLPVLQEVRRVRMTGLKLKLDDARADRVWEVTGGGLTLEQRADEVEFDLRFSLENDQGALPANVAMSFVSARESPAARVSVRVAGVRAEDVAAQSPGMGWLGVLDAPISGEFSAIIDDDGKIGLVHGELSLAAGSLSPVVDAPPVPFERAALSLDFDPESERLTLNRIELFSKQMRLTGQGRIYPEEPGVMTGGALPGAFLVQLQLEDMQVDPEGVFSEPVRFGAGMIDLRLGVSPLKIDLGQMVLIDGERRLSARGHAVAEADGWGVSLDVALNEIAHDRLLALWPPALVAKTRIWVSENVFAGILHNVDGALRIEAGEQPRLTLGYEYRDADVRFVRSLPPVTQASGYATIQGNTYTTTVLAGHVDAPEGGRLDVAGTAFQVPDITERPGTGKVDLNADGPITAALSLLNQPPFRFLDKAGRDVDLARGRAVIKAHISVPLLRGVPASEVRFSGTGRLLDVSSDVLVPGRAFRADELSLRADDAGMEISGSGTLSNVPFAATWRQAFGKENAGRSEVRGTVELSQGFSDAFGVGLPPDMLSGAATGRIAIDLQQDAPPEFRLSSTLEGLGVRIPQVGWSKTRGASGSLEVSGRLAKPAEVDLLRFSAPGLSAEGGVTLTPEGRLDALELTQVRLGGWLRDANVVLRPRGEGLGLRVAVQGGVMVLGELPQRLSNDTGDGGKGGSGTPISVALDRLVVSENLSLTGFRGQFSTVGGFNGQFQAAVNDGPQVVGTVAPSGARSAVRLRADDAGAVFSAARTVQTARGGAMDLVLTPRPTPGEYDGKLTVTDMRVVDAPILAAMLNAISVVGLLEQLTGDGLAFNRVTADFTLTPTTIKVSSASAVGASLGVSMRGSYGLVSRRMAFQGVFSPIYMINRIGSFLTRRGEGLFGFNYSVTGTADAPRVSVNPLSILAPSALRNLLRGNPEDITE